MKASSFILMVFLKLSNCIPLIRGNTSYKKYEILFLNCIPLIEVLPLIRGMEFDNFKKTIKINELAVK